MTRGPGQSGGLVSRVFGAGEDPLTWAVSLWRVGPTRYRLHAIVPLFVVAELIWSIPENRLGLPFVAMLLAAMGVCVALLLAGSAFARRRTRSEAPEEVVIWPMGELSASLPRAGDITSGVATLLTLLLIALASLAGLLIGSSVADTPDLGRTLNPLNPGLAVVTMPRRLLPLWSVYSVSTTLLVAHLLPSMPVAGGRIVAALLARSRGECRAGMLVGGIGRVVGVALALLGLITGATLMLALGLGLGLVSHVSRQRARFLCEPEGEAMLDEAAGPKPSSEEIDRILGKISQDGFQSLSSQERSALDRASHATPSGSDR